MNRVITFFVVFILFLLPTISIAQIKQFNATVVSASTGQPLISVTVRNNSNAKIATTDQAGRFSISAAPGAVLSFSYVGHVTKEISIDSLSANDSISLEPADNSLDAVVVTALGVSKQKKSLGYAVQELKGSSISEAKETNVVNALAGKVAGVRVTNTQGDMGSSRIVIRGETSIAGNNQPLFIVDDVPVDNSQLGAGGSRDFRNAIADLNAEDIESISVLKGPNAAALYGSRAAHGVVLIKTKSGKNKKGLGITINSNTNFSNILILPDYQNVFGQGSEGKFSYVDGKGAGINDGVDESWGPKLNGQLIPQFYSKGVAVPFVAHPDNVRDYFKTGVTYSNSVSLDGGLADVYNYHIAFNNEKQYGVIPNSEAAKKQYCLQCHLFHHTKS